MTLAPGLKVLLIMNNYFHDVATALLLASAVILWVLGRQAKAQGPGSLRFMAIAYATLTRFAIGALVWIIVGGIPRTIFFAQLEWDPAVTRFLVPALIVKHVLMFAAVTSGAVLWAKTRAVMRELDDQDGSEKSASAASAA